MREGVGEVRKRGKRTTDIEFNATETPKSTESFYLKSFYVILSFCGNVSRGYFSSAFLSVWRLIAGG